MRRRPTDMVTPVTDAANRVPAEAGVRHDRSMASAARLTAPASDLDAGALLLRAGARVEVVVAHPLASWHAEVDDLDHDIVKLRGRREVPDAFEALAAVHVCVADGRALLRVHARVLEVNDHVMRLVLDGDVDRVQRRVHFRLEMEQDVPVTVQRCDGSVARTSAHLVDLSAGGYALRLRAPLTVGDDVVAHLWLEGEKLELPATVVRVWSDDDGNSFAGLQLCRLPGATEAAIVRYLFAEQRKLAVDRAS